MEDTYHTRFSDATNNYWKNVASARSGIIAEKERRIAELCEQNRELHSSHYDPEGTAQRLAQAEKKLGESQAALKHIVKLHVSCGKCEQGTNLSTAFASELELENKRLNDVVADLTNIIYNNGVLASHSMPPLMRSLQQTVNLHAARAEAAEAELAKSKKETAGTMRVSIGKILDTESQVRALEDRLNKEKEFRQRVWERFKRIRRDAALGSIHLQQVRAENEKLKKQLDEAQKTSTVMDKNAARFATLAYAILEAEDAEKKGKEPSWP